MIISRADGRARRSLGRSRVEVAVRSNEVVRFKAKRDWVVVQTMKQSPRQARTAVVVVVVAVAAIVVRSHP